MLELSDKQRHVAWKIVLLAPARVIGGIEPGHALLPLIAWPD
jgi:hypothetical protein